MERDSLKKGILNGELRVADQFKTDEELISARSIFTKVKNIYEWNFGKEFYELFAGGFKQYIDG